MDSDVTMKNHRMKNEINGQDWYVNFSFSCASILPLAVLLLVFFASVFAQNVTFIFACIFAGLFAVFFAGIFASIFAGVFVLEGYDLSNIEIFGSLLC